LIEVVSLKRDCDDVGYRGQEIGIPLGEMPWLFPIGSNLTDDVAFL